MKKRIALGMAVVLMMSVLAGCGAAEDAGAADAAGDAAGKTVVKVGIGSSYPPFCYLDEDEKEAGYDYDTVMAIADMLSDKYTFEICPDSFQNLLVGLDTNAYDVAVHHFTYVEERTQNYLYAEEGNMYVPYFVIGYLAGRTDITDLESCKGMTGVCSAGTKTDNMLQQWNAEHPDAQVEIAYAESQEVLATGIQNGLYDFFVYSELDFETFNRQYDNIFETSSEESDYIADENCGSYFIYSLGSESLQQDIDAAIAALRDNGTLADLSEKWFGKDYSAKK